MGGIGVKEEEEGEEDEEKKVEERRRRRGRIWVERKNLNTGIEKN